MQLHVGLSSLFGGQRESSSSISDVFANVVCLLLRRDDQTWRRQLERLAATLGGRLETPSVILEVSLDSKALWLDRGKRSLPALEPVQIVCYEVLGQEPVLPGRQKHGQNTWEFSEELRGLSSLKANRSNDGQAVSPRQALNSF